MPRFLDTRNSSPPLSFTLLEQVILKKGGTPIARGDGSLDMEEESSLPHSASGPGGATALPECDLPSCYPRLMRSLQ